MSNACSSKGRNSSKKLASSTPRGDLATAQLRKVHDKLDEQQRARFKALLVLAQLGENTLNKIFGGRDATGTVMRKHLQPLTTQINKTINTLLS